MFFTIKAYAASSGGDHWVTINGTHVLIGDSGKIKKGPDKFIGSTVAEMKKATSTSKSSTSKTTKKTATTKKEATKSGSAKSAKKEDNNKSNDTFFDKKNLKSVDKEVKEFAGYYKEMGKTSSDDIDPIDMSTLTGVEINEITGKAYDIDTGRILTTAEANARADYVSQQFDKIFSGAKTSSTKSTQSTSTDTFFDKKNLKSLDREIKETSEFLKEGGRSVKKVSAGDIEYFLGMEQRGNQFFDRDTGRLLSKSEVDARTNYVMKQLDKNGLPSQSVKYPSGITTPAQKRAYTRAINSGKTVSEAKKSALGKSTTSTKSATTKTSATPAKKTTAKASTPKKTTVTKKPTTTKTTSKKAEPKGKYTADNIPQVAGASKGVMRKTANYMNRGASFEDAFSRALGSAGYGLGTRRGMFR